ncbi:PilZ domain-containing protein [bacterium]|nr:PilZ domain-containing protein [bacterium]
MRFNLFRFLRLNRDADPDSALTSPDSEAEQQNPVARELVLRATIDGAPVDGLELFDMNIRGARVLVPFQFAPTEIADQAVALDVEHETGNWTIRVHARMIQLNHWGDDRVMLELEFTRVGELYAQLDNALGRYFNRRDSDRVAPAEHERVGVRIAYGPHRVRGLASDLSSTGLCARAPLVQAAVFQLGEHVKAFISLPGRDEEIEVAGVVKHGYRKSEDVFLGIEFDLSAPCAMTSRRTEYLKYIEQRRKASRVQGKSRRLGA